MRNKKPLSAPHLMLTAYLLSIVLSAHPPATLAQQSTATAGLTLDFTAQVYRRTRQDKELIRKLEPVENLTKNEFRLFEDGREQTIASVARESRPLSMVVIVVLGRAELCGDSGDAGIGKLMSWVAMSLEKGLKPKDELAIVLTDETGRMVREFGDTATTVRADFDEVARISKASVVTMTSTRPGYSAYDTKINYPEVALRKSITYLRERKKPANRSVVMFVKNLPNAAETTLSAQKELTTSILQGEILVNWLTNPGPEKFFGITTRDYSRGIYYFGLPDLTGGETPYCYYYYVDLVKEEVEKQIPAMLERLRTRYRITYVSTDPTRDGKVRQLKLELAPQWTKGKDKKDVPVVRAPQAIIAPGP